ncbi:MAG: 3-isopropylmalate dehydratase small subunit [Hyphomicrobiaceae bacterium]
MTKSGNKQFRAFDRLTSTAIAIDQPNVDTDQIIPARYLALPREQQVPHLFHDLRYRDDHAPREGFPLNAPTAAGAEILIAEHNFGCGSSREHAVSVLVDNGFRVFIAPSFGDIFHNNCFQNGALPIRLPAARVREMLDHVAKRPDARITVDLEAQTVTGPDNWTQSFEIDSFRKQCLLQGTDDISLTLTYADAIAAHERRAAAEADWL